MTQFPVVVLFMLSLSLIRADHADRAGQIPEMEHVLMAEGLSSFVLQVGAKGWVIPWIPSKWRLDGVQNAEERKKYEKSRAFGLLLARGLADLSVKIHDDSDKEALRRHASEAVLLSQWCGAVAGYGNYMLAQRCVDLASVAIAKLAADTSFPIEECEQLLGKIERSWTALGPRLAVLNSELNSVVLAPTSQETLESSWSAGFSLSREVRSDRINALKGAFREEAKAGADVPDHLLSVFIDDEISLIQLPTLVGMWDKKWHKGVVQEMWPRNHGKAVALVRFRKVVGEFPEEPVFTAEETARTELLIAQSAEKGIVVSPFASAYSSVQEAAFAQAWDKKVDVKKPENVAVYTRAWRTYDAVRKGVLYDDDTWYQMQKNSGYKMERKKEAGL